MKSPLSHSAPETVQSPANSPAAPSVTSAEICPPAPLVLGEVGSVLDEAHARIAAGTLPPWGSVLASTQTAGRGQLRRHWHSPPGNIYAALHLPKADPFVGSEAAPALGALTAAALENVCRAMPGCAGERLTLRFKWPNDVVCLPDSLDSLNSLGRAPRKVGGILLEERNGCLVAGIGINVCHAPPRELLRSGHAMAAACLTDVINMLPQQDKSSSLASAALACEVWLQLVRAMHFWYTKEFLAPTQWLALADAFLLWKNRRVFLVDAQPDAASDVLPDATPDVVPTVLSGVLPDANRGGEEAREVHGTLLGLAPSGGIRLSVDGRERVFLSGSLSVHAGA